MDTITSLLGTALSQTLVSLSHNWPYLVASIVIAAALKTFANAEKTAARLSRFQGAGVLAASVAAVVTPFCSCGTTAVVLGMMAGTMPLAPIVAFMVASPLSSPGELLYAAGLFGWPFAIAHFAASLLLGLIGGGVTAILERRGFLKNQTRIALREKPGCACGTKPVAVPTAARRAKDFHEATISISRRLLPMFLAFAFIGYFLNGLIPASAIRAVFGSGASFAVPLAATLGLPLYVNSDAALPLIRTLMDSGMSQGAVMAFLVAGAGTSVGAITGALTIARWRVVALVVAVLWMGAMASGFAFDALIAVGMGA